MRTHTNVQFVSEIFDIYFVIISVPFFHFSFFFQVLSNLSQAREGHQNEIYEMLALIQIIVRSALDELGPTKPFTTK